MSRALLELQVQPRSPQVHVVRESMALWMHEAAQKGTTAVCTLADVVVTVTTGPMVPGAVVFRVVAAAVVGGAVTETPPPVAVACLSSTPRKRRRRASAHENWESSTPTPIAARSNRIVMSRDGDVESE